MSRNFELLQQAGKFQEIPPVAREEQSLLVDAAATGTPVLEMTGMARDEITKLVKRLFMIPKAGAPRSVVFAATETGNGCSWLCARSAELLASLVRGSVCLLDGNLRSSGLHRQFGLEDYSGLSGATGQNESIRRYAQPLSMPNLWLLGWGSTADSAQAPLAMDRLRTVLRDLRKQFDHIIVDAGALDRGTDGIVLSSLADGAVLVLKANSSRKDSARKALQEFQAANVPVLGVVLNRRSFPIPEAIYKRL